MTARIEQKLHGFGAACLAIFENLATVRGGAIVGHRAAAFCGCGAE
jgi:hypothetical protein